MGRIEKTIKSQEGNVRRAVLTCGRDAIAQRDLKSPEAFLAEVVHEIEVAGLDAVLLEKHHSLVEGEQRHEVQLVDVQVLQFLRSRQKHPIHLLAGSSRGPCKVFSNDELNKNGSVSIQKSLLILEGQIGEFLLLQSKVFKQIADQVQMTFL